MFSLFDYNIYFLLLLLFFITTLTRANNVKLEIIGCVFHAMILKVSPLRNWLNNAKQLPSSSCNVYLLLICISYSFYCKGFYSVFSSNGYRCSCTVFIFISYDWPYLLQWVMLLATKTPFEHHFTFFSSLWGNLKPISLTPRILTL